MRSSAAHTQDDNVQVLVTLHSIVYSNSLFISLVLNFDFLAVLTLRHSISPSEYEPVLAGDDIVNLAVVIKDIRTEERVLATQEFNISSSQITIKVKAALCVYSHFEIFSS